MEKQMNVEVNNSVVTYILKTTEGMNKLNTQSIKELIQAAKEAVIKGAKVFVIEGQEDYFCGGGTIGDFLVLSGPEVNAFGVLLQEMIFTLKTLPIPVIAAVKGHAFGGGLSLVEACDIVVCSEDAEFAIPEIKGGFCPAIALVSVYSLFGNGIAKQMAMTGSSMKALKAFELGLVTVLTRKANVDELVQQEVEKVLKGNPTAYRVTKEITFKLSEASLRNAYTMATGKLVEFLTSQDAKEVILAQRESRDKSFLMR
jgi:enoyl-CoA hydratase/carnithine racemase